MYCAVRITQWSWAGREVAAGNTLLPVLTRHLSAGDLQAAHKAQNRSVEYVVLLTLPAVAGLLVLAGPIMIVLFGHGSFTEHDALLSAQSLRAYAVGLPAFILVKVLSPAFFARGDTRTPVYVGIGVLVLNFVLNLLFMTPLAHVGPPLASSITACVNVAFLVVLLRRKDALVVYGSTLSHMGRVCIAAGLMGVCLWGAGSVVALPAIFVTKALWLAGMVMAGGALYAALLHVFGVVNLADLLARIQGRLRRRAG